MSEINIYLADLIQEITERSIDLEGSEPKAQIFTSLVADYLSEAEEIDDIICVSGGFQNADLKVHVDGYFIAEPGTVDLFVSEFHGGFEPKTLLKKDREKRFRWCRNFFEKSMKGLHEKLEPASEVFSLANQIYVGREDVRHLRIYLLTDKVTKDVDMVHEEVNGVHVSYFICDLNRLHKMATTGIEKEIISINFVKEFGQGIPCLKMQNENEIYCTYLGLLTGEMLAAIYDKYGSRLLEKNVRSFLQLRGKVNQGLRDTIVSNAHMFLAYNNGLTIAVENAQVGRDASGQMCIEAVRDFQIVNGGQTTAAIYHTSTDKKLKADLSEILVQAKITEILTDDPAEANNLTKNISKFANSQNAVSTPDLASNDPYHRELERLSRAIWAPSKPPSMLLTRWFYERARGAYQNEQLKLTPAKKKKWREDNPSPQKFTKTDIAKYEMTWLQAPNIVCRGGQFSFKEFTAKLNSQEKMKKLGQRDFHHLIAKAILFKRADKIIKDQKYGDYKSQNIAYTLAFLVNKTDSRINLDEIWKNQDISEMLEHEITLISGQFFRYLMKNAAGGTNVGQLCKRQECWDEFQNLMVSYKINSQTRSELLPPGAIGRGTGRAIDEDDIENVDFVVSFGTKGWRRALKWANTHDHLDSWEIETLDNICTSLRFDKTVSSELAKHAKPILEKAMSAGMIP